MMADFQNALISRVFTVFSTSFLTQDNSRMDFDMFFGILIFEPK